MCYNYEGAKQQISLYSHASYQTGPIVEDFWNKVKQGIFIIIKISLKLS